MFVIQNVVKTAARTVFHDESQFGFQAQTEELHHVFGVNFAANNISKKKKENNDTSYSVGLV